MTLQQDKGFITAPGIGPRGGLCRNNKLYHLTPNHLKKINKMIKKGTLPAEALTEFPEPVLTQFPDTLLYQLSDNKTQILNGKQKPVLNLTGPPNEIEKLGNLELMGITIHFLDLYKTMIFRTSSGSPGGLMRVV